MHEVRAEPLDHRTRSAGLETGEACQRTSHPPQLQMGSTCYGSGTAAPSGSHLLWEGYPLKQNPVVEAPCPGPSNVAGGGGGHPPPLKGVIFFRAFGQSNIFSGTFAVSVDQQFSSAPLKTQHHWGGGGGLDPPRPLQPPLKGALAEDPCVRHVRVPFHMSGGQTEIASSRAFAGGRSPGARGCVDAPPPPPIPPPRRSLSLSWAWTRPPRSSLLHSRCPRATPEARSRTVGGETPIAARAPVRLCKRCLFARARTLTRCGTRNAMVLFGGDAQRDGPAQCTCSQMPPPSSSIVLSVPSGQRNAEV